MGDFPPEWQLDSDLDEGGQGHTYRVTRSGDPEKKLYVLKRLKNPKREEYFDREIRACIDLEHSNILKIVDYGHTPKGKPFLVAEYCEGGSLEDSGHPFTEPLLGLKLFREVCSAIAYGHERNIFHLDIKPANIFLRSTGAVVGDYGICYIEADQLAMTSDGPRGSMYYCAPELRGPKIDARVPGASDVYSLGKLLYWLFTHEIYDGHEEDYSNEPSRRLAEKFPSYPQFAFLDDIVAGTVLRNPYERIKFGFSSAVSLLNSVAETIRKIEAGARVLDLRLKQRCSYCAVGTYRPAHETIRLTGFEPARGFPLLDRRQTHHNSTDTGQGDIYEQMKRVAEDIVGSTHGYARGAPLYLACDYCGHVEHFRL